MRAATARDEAGNSARQQPGRRVLCRTGAGGGNITDASHLRARPRHARRMAASHREGGHTL